jgi:hypothetical protein
MTELVTLPEANHVMLILLIAAPVIGLIWGALTKQLVRGLVYGVAIGGGNFAMWTIYNAITNALGLDTVKNLIVNLVLFIVVGAAAGFAAGRLSRRATKDSSTESAE